MSLSCSDVSPVPTDLDLLRSETVMCQFEERHQWVLLDALQVIVLWLRVKFLFEDRTLRPDLYAVVVGQHKRRTTCGTGRHTSSGLSSPNGSRLLSSRSV